MEEGEEREGGGCFEQFLNVEGIVEKFCLQTQHAATPANEDEEGRKARLNGWQLD